MDYELTDEISSLLKADKLNEAIAIAEGKLKLQMETDFNKVLGKNLLHLTDDLINYINDFYTQVSPNLKVKAIYSEMNGFTINYDLWFLDLFAYDKFGGMDDTDWLADWEKENSTTEIFVITSYEELQAAYEDYMENEGYKDDKREAAANICELLIVMRLQELFKEAVERAKARKLEWASIPILASAHDYYDIVHKVN